MKWTMYFWLVSVVVLYSYLIYIRIKFGVIPSISNSAYKLKDKYGKNYGYIFTGVMWLTAFMLIPVVLEAGHYFMFLPTACLLFVGAAPWYSDSELEEKVHTRNAMVSAIASIIAIGVTYELCIVGMATLALVLALYSEMIKTPNKTYKAELVIFFIVHLVVLFKDVL